MSDVKLKCPGCQGVGTRQGVTMVDFGHGEQEAVKCARCNGYGIIYAKPPATEAKPSASAAPGKLYVFEFGAGEYYSKEDADAAIAAARKEGFEAGRLYEQEIATQEAEEAADRAEAEAVKRAEACSVPPTGWHCTRAAGHSGPCAAHPAQPQAKAPQQPPAGESKPLTRCAASRDGECSKPGCPQLRDNEPARSGRHCPLPDHDE